MLRDMMPQFELYQPASLDNALGRENAFDVAYSADYTTRRPITTATPRSFYIGCSITR